MKKKDHEYVQWGYDLVHNAYLNHQEDSARTDHLYLNYLAPFSNEFFGPTNPVIFFGGHTFKNLSKLPYWTLRDGVIPLTIFFKESEPEQVKGEIFIHKDLWFVVPENWRKKVKYFSVEPDVLYDKNNLPKKIFISGILNSTLADPDEFDENLKLLADTLGKENLKKIEIFSYFPDKRNDLWGSWEEENVLKYSKAIFENLKLDIQVPEWRLIHSEVNYKDCLYYEVNSGLFIKDSYLQHFTLSRGAGGLKKAASPMDSAFKKISESRSSLYHKLFIYECDYAQMGKYENPFEHENFRYFKKIIEHTNLHKRVNFYWEKWYATYVKNFYKSKLK